MMSPSIAAREWLALGTTCPKTITPPAGNGKRRIIRRGLPAAASRSGGISCFLGVGVGSIMKGVAAVAVRSQFPENFARMSPRRGQFGWALRLGCLIAAAWGCACAGEAWAQAETTAADTAFQVAKPSTASAAAPAAGNEGSADRDPIMIRRSDGQLVPTGLTWEQLRALLKLQNEPKPAFVPDYFVTSVVLSGEANETQALLTATIEVKLNQLDRWVAVPLRMSEATLREAPVYEGAGEHGPGENSRLQAEAGYVWWFRGAGPHRLTLPLVVPVRRVALSRRLALSVPPTAVSSLALRVDVPETDLRVTPPPTAAWSLEPAGEAATHIVVQGFAPNLDLQWQDVPHSKPTQSELEVVTNLEVNLTTDLMVLVAEQTIRASRGTFSELTVHLPEGFERPNIECDLYAGHEIDPQRPGRVTLRLTEATAGPLRVRWTLEALQAGFDNLPVVAGFDVENARRQTGDIVIAVADGFHISLAEGENVYRRNVTAAVESTHVASAYRFHKQPFRMRLEAHQIPPYYQVRPLVLLKLAGQRMELDARFQVEVFRDRGALDLLEVQWPSRTDQGWKVDTSWLLALSDQIETEPATGALRVRFPTRKTGAFEVRLKAERPLAPGAGAVDVTLPRIDGPRRSPTLLVLVTEDNLETAVTLRDDPSARPLSGEALEQVVLPDSWRELQRSGWQLESPERPFSIGVEVREREVETSTLIAIRQEADHLRVSQRIEYDVRYERMKELALSLPAGPERSYVFVSSDGVMLPWEATGADVNGRPLIRVDLGEGRLHRIAVTADFDVPFDQELFPGESSRLEVPLVHSDDSPFESVRVQIDSNGGPYQLAISDGAWTADLQAAGGRAWTTSGVAEFVPLDVSYGPAAGDGAYSIRKALVRTQYDAGGFARSVAAFEIVGPVPVLLLHVPRQIQVEKLAVAGREIGGDRISVRQVESGAQYRVELGFEGGSSRLLTVNFRTAEAFHFGWSEHRQLLLPQFPSDVWVEHLLWEVHLPFTQHLFLPPFGYSADYQWKRFGVVWRRVPLRGGPQLAEWFGPQYELPELPAGPGDGHVYQFSRFGPAAALEFRTMSRSIVVLLGAGLALAAGFALMRIPATRNMLTGLLVAFVLAACGVWFTAPIQLLLQPALLGLGLAVIAAVIDESLRRRRRGTLTLSPASEFDLAMPTTESAMSRVGLLAVGSDEATAVGPVPAVLAERSEPVSTASELGPR